MSIYGTLFKIESNHDNLREGQAYGSFKELPVIGERFVLIGRGLEDPATVRHVITTKVKEVVKEDKYLYTFKTENSTYKLELVPYSEDLHFCGC